ncbi:hypothetical protein [Streptomyces spectabilis]|uniref:Uncharacterized protein n=1 Tax=Streptomyces spectabilis TaxID=68270 RepID=A0A7W8ANA5_STRST|nr:hypothetical protein [Streptomyces spectabilis]MBB5101477.1 hypothetical protein [Streptomyces spectabilis]MCI3900669.1 hypothetical protein [Streptomyces spectabilis]
MSNRRRGTGSAARRAAPLLVVRCAALFAVLVWMLPVCGHASNAAAPPPVTSAAPLASGTTSLATSTNVLSGREHTCPDLEHGPGEAHCRPAAGAAVATAKAAPGPLPLSTDVTAAPWVAESAAARGAPDAPAPTPGIHQLQVQRT